MLNLTSCILVGSRITSLNERHSKGLHDCGRLTADWESAAQLWEGGVEVLAAALQSVPQLALRDLEVRNVQLDSHGLYRLADALSISRDSSVPDDVRMSRAPWLRSLVLEANGLRASDVVALAGLVATIPSLHSLGLRSNLIGDDGVHVLQKLWPRGGSLQALELTDAGLGPNSFGALAVIATRALSSGCFNLSIDRHRGPSMIAAAASDAARRRAKPNGGRSRVGSTRIGAYRPILAFERSRKGHLRARHTTRVPIEAGTGRLNDHSPGVMALALARSSLRDSDAIQLADLLRSYECEGGVFAATYRMGSSIGHDCHGVGPQIMSRTLTSLDISGNLLSDVGVVMVAMAALRLPRLALIDVRENPVGVDGFKSLLSLATHPSLTSLMMPQPTDIDFQGRQRRRSIDMFSLEHSALRELRFRASWLTQQPHAWFTLASSLRKGSALTTLDLTRASMDTSAVAALANVLASPACRLVTLGLNGNGLSVRSVVHLARSLANNTRLRKIELNHNHVGIAGAQALIASAISGGALLAVSLVNAGVGVKWYSLLHHQLKINLAHVPRVAGAAGGSEL
jgi:hypothetical protein